MKTRAQTVLNDSIIKNTRTETEVHLVSIKRPLLRNVQLALQTKNAHLGAEGGSVRDGSADIHRGSLSSCDSQLPLWQRTRS
jgi:hypothetical protein